jgi:glutamate dehydrogenase/leucine dehydrogenase
MKELLKIFENKKPHIVFEWNDSETDAQGWIVINSLRGGAAGGGTRMRKGLDKREVESLAKTMEVKFTVSGPSIGGAKSGINFDPADSRKKEVLQRWYKAVIPILKNYYGTGGDLNVDEIHEVIPMTENYGLWHPQEGVVNGHFKSNEGEKIRKIGQLRTGVSKVVNDELFSPDPSKKFLIADLVTGYGVAESVKHFYDIQKINYSGKKVIVQGWGNVGSAAAYYLSNMGFKIVAIIDRNGGLLNKDGFSKSEVKELYLNKEKNTLLSDSIIPFAVLDKIVWDTNAAIFLPCAASRLVTQPQVDRMIANGLELISCGANVPFADPEIFFGSIMEQVDQKITVIPDFIANCGMARVFAYCMQTGSDLSDKAIFNDISNIIKNALENIYAINKTKTNISKSGFEIALKQLV